MLRIDVYHGNLTINPLTNTFSWTRGQAMNGNPFGYVNPLGNRSPGQGGMFSEDWYYDDALGSDASHKPTPWEMHFVNDTQGPGGHTPRQADITRLQALPAQVVGKKIVGKGLTAALQFHLGTYAIGFDAPGQQGAGQVAAFQGGYEVWVVQGGAMPPIAPGVSHYSLQTHAVGDINHLSQLAQQPGVGIFEVQHY